jgi:acyl transferase domain-containing protein/NAD(P)H-dependent flavin oxidoreductase YrpB (nitropropane dioxygenase family)/NAD(P)-dependent dehydrogenase (short-subunit alcohol dehydrogenase family)
MIRKYFSKTFARGLTVSSLSKIRPGVMESESQFQFAALTLPGLPDPAIAIAANRAGGLGVLDLEFSDDIRIAIHNIEAMVDKTNNNCGIKLDGKNDNFINEIISRLPDCFNTILLTICSQEKLHQHISKFHELKKLVFIVVTSLEQARLAEQMCADGLIVKGNEAAGFVGEKTSFILLQQVVSEISLPVWVQGGIGLYTAAACYTAGASGIVLDSQLALTRESPLPESVKRIISKMDGRESICIGDNIGHLFRIYGRPGFPVIDTLINRAVTLKKENLKNYELWSIWHEFIRKQTFWKDKGNSVWLIGQDAAFAAHLAKRFGTVGSIFNAIRQTVHKNIQLAKTNKILQENSPLALSHGTKYPIVQGPMARVSDKAAFALQVAEAGGLPFIALSKLNGNDITKMLKEVVGVIGTKPWGVGILGFNESNLLKSQIEAIEYYHPTFAVLAGGIPSLAETLESKGIRTYVHVQSADLMKMFIGSGIKRFIFEGRECGGHIGPRTSFVLWEDMVGKLLEILEKPECNPEELHILFAGGIHDALSGAMVASIAAPLAELGVRVGVLMGTAYLFTNEILESGAIVRGFQGNALQCTETHVLESGPGHEIRCCKTPIIELFEKEKTKMKSEGLPADQISSQIDKLMLGRLRVASKGVMRMPVSGSGKNKPDIVSLSEEKQHEEGIYMVGQLAALRDQTFSISELHNDIAVGSSDILSLLSADINGKNADTQRPSDIAIIGMACLFPKAGDIQTYWENILNKTNAITEIPSNRWDWHLYYNEDRYAKDKIYSKWGGFIDDLSFDPTRYGIPPKSIESIDPMQLMALEVARRTLVDAGYEEREFDRERASVILGASGVGDVGMQYGLRAELPRFKGDLPDSVAKRLPEWTEDTFAGILLNVIAGRIANRFNLGGVNFTTDAACASSLAAIYQGVSELVTGRSNLVIAGGVDTVQGPFSYLCFSKTQALSPRGRCCTFDVSADGIVISEGIAMIALKRLEDAERDGDRIYAVIKGIGGSSDGKAKGLSAPLPAGQLRALRRAYEHAGFGPDTIGLFEAHGTGTVAGDTAELESTTTLLKEAGCKPHQAVIGSVKTMIGHTKATAGIAGLIKATLALHHRVLPPHFGVNQPNQLLQQPDSPLYLVDQTIPWLTAKGQPRRAAASAFGFGGTNFHVVLEEYTAEYRPWLRTAVSQHWPAELLLWRGIDREDLTTQLTHIQQELEKIASIELRDIAYNLAKVYQTGGETLAIVATDPGDLANKIGAALSYLSGESSTLSPGVYHSDSAEIDGKVAVLFPGQGAQYAGMLRELALNFPVFAETLSEADELLSECFAARFGEDVRLSHFIFPRGSYNKQAKADATRALTSTDVAQPALGAIGAGLWKLMGTLGLEPDMLGGHSYGEFTALFAGDVIDFDALMSLSEARGRFIVDAVKDAGTELGTMAAIKASRDDVEKAISDIDGVVIANHNAPQQCVISGSIAAIKEAVAKMSQAGMLVSKIPVAAAFHSRFVKPAQSALADLINKTVWRDNKIPVYSNTTGKLHAKDVEQVKQVMTDHLVQPVEFLAEIEAMYRDGARVFLELGPKAVLTGLVDRILEVRPHKAIAIDGNGSGITGMLHAFGQLLSAGVKLDVIKLFEGRGCFNGDPAHLARMQRSQPEPKHAWLLNGSRARRATEPVKQIGIRIDELSSRSTSLPKSEADLPSGPDNNSIVTSKFVSRKHRKEESQMENRRQVPIAGEPAVMAEYFHTMRQFLETQERIMVMYMGGTTNSRRSGQWQMRRVQPQTFRENLEHEHYKSDMQTRLPQQLKSPSGAAAETIAQVKLTAVPGVSKAPDAAASQSEKASGKGGFENQPDEHIDRGKITDMLLSIIEEKTGYPPDMVGLTQNLEADLGIDSIKRIEIVGALLKALPPSYRQRLGKDFGGLNTQATLNGMLDLLDEIKVEGGTAVPFDQAEMGSTTYRTSHSFRHVIEPKQESIDEFAIKRLGKGHFIITLDTLGVAAELSDLLRARKCTVSIIEREILKDENSLNQWCLSLETDIDAIAGIVHLAQIGSDWLQTDTPTQLWRNQLQLNEKSLFILLHNLNGKLNDDAHILSASALGGFFSRNKNNSSGLSLQGGSVGLLKSLIEEQPKLRVKAVDIDPEQQVHAIAKSLMDELELAGGRLEVGYPEGKRTIFQTVSESLDEKDERLDAIRYMVVLATGGLRGVTAELLRELALPGNILLLTGRSPLPSDEPEDIKSLATPSDLRNHFISEVRNGNLRLTPAEIQRKVQSVLGSREMRNNIADFKKRGAKVEYYSVDVTNDAAMRQLLDSIYAEYNRINAVVHGAGVIEDKLLVDKTSDSWSRVVETKVVGLLLLQKYLRPESLRFFTVLSSVAGRYGNSGQTDYATANELMNRLCCQLSNNWGNKVNVRALCWGPWGRLTFGPGMVTEETEAKFARRSIFLVSPETGSRLFKDELTHEGSHNIEVVCGEGPWEQIEAEIGRIERNSETVQSYNYVAQNDTETRESPTQVIGK